MRARVLVGVTSRRSSGATRSGIDREFEASKLVVEPGARLSPACICSSLSGSMVMASVSTVAERGDGARDDLALGDRLCTRASISPRGTG